MDYTSTPNHAITQQHKLSILAAVALTRSLRGVKAISMSLRGHVSPYSLYVAWPPLLSLTQRIPLYYNARTDNLPQ